MTKKYWVGVMLFCLLLTGASGFFLFFTFQNKATVEVPLNTPSMDKESNRVPPKSDLTSPGQMAPTAEDVKEMPEAPDKDLIKGTTDQAVDSIKEDIIEKKVSLRNILFTLHSGSAKKVFLIGDFNEWFREPLTKKSGNLWTIAKKLEPGSYEYQYVINGRRIRDPNNSRVSDNGKSILIVKPIAGP